MDVKNTKIIFTCRHSSLLSLSIRPSILFFPAPAPPLSITEIETALRSCHKSGLRSRFL
jgi:hypothetical protein